MKAEQLPLSPQERRQEYFVESQKEREEKERARQEIAELFHDTLHPEVIRRLFQRGYDFGPLHKRFKILIEFGQAKAEDEKTYIEAVNGWREEPFPIKEWDKKLAWVIPEKNGLPHS